MKDTRDEKCSIDYDMFVESLSEVVMLWAEELTVKSIGKLFSQLVNCIRCQSSFTMDLTVNSGATAVTQRLAKSLSSFSNCRVHSLSCFSLSSSLICAAATESMPDPQRVNNQNPLIQLR